MIVRRRMMSSTGLLLALLFLLGSALQASAHGRTIVGDYELVIGFANEPAYAGMPNGLELRVTNTKTGASVTGLDKTLKAEIIRGAARRELAIRPVFGEEGAYTADVLPTLAGDYTWRIFGSIEGTPVEVSMTSGPTTFSPVETVASVSFPAAEPSNAELRAAADSAAQTARIALGFGAAGTLLGLGGLLTALRQRNSGTVRSGAAPSSAAGASGETRRG